MQSKRVSKGGKKSLKNMSLQPTRPTARPPPVQQNQPPKRQNVKVISNESFQPSLPEPVNPITTQPAIPPKPLPAPTEAKPAAPEPATAPQAPPQQSKAASILARKMAALKAKTSAESQAGETKPQPEPARPATNRASLQPQLTPAAESTQTTLPEAGSTLASPTPSTVPISQGLRPYDPSQGKAAAPPRPAETPAKSPAKQDAPAQTSTLKSLQPTLPMAQQPAKTPTPAETPIKATTVTETKPPVRPSLRPAGDSGLTPVSATPAKRPLSDPPVAQKPVESTPRATPTPRQTTAPGTKPTPAQSTASKSLQPTVDTQPPSAPKPTPAASVPQPAQSTIPTPLQPKPAQSTSRPSLQPRVEDDSELPAAKKQRASASSLRPVDGGQNAQAIVQLTPHTPAQVKPTPGRPSAPASSRQSLQPVMPPAAAVKTDVQPAKPPALSKPPMQTQTPSKPVAAPEATPSQTVPTPTSSVSATIVPEMNDFDSVKHRAITQDQYTRARNALKLLDQLTTLQQRTKVLVAQFRGNLATHHQKVAMIAVQFKTDYQDPQHYYPQSSSIVEAMEEKMKSSTDVAPLSVESQPESQLQSASEPQLDKTGTISAVQGDVNTEGVPGEAKTSQSDDHVAETAQNTVAVSSTQDQGKDEAADLESSVPTDVTPTDVTTISDAVDDSVDISQQAEETMDAMDDNEPIGTLPSDAALLADQTAVPVDTDASQKSTDATLGLTTPDIPSISSTSASIETEPTPLPDTVTPQLTATSDSQQDNNIIEDAMTDEPQPTLADEVAQPLVDSDINVDVDNEQTIDDGLEIGQDEQLTVDETMNDDEDVDADVDVDAEADVDMDVVDALDPVEDPVENQNGDDVIENETQLPPSNDWNTMETNKIDTQIAYSDAVTPTALADEQPLPPEHSTTTTAHPSEDTTDSSVNTTFSETTMIEESQPADITTQDEEDTPQAIVQTSEMTLVDTEIPSLAHIVPEPTVEDAPADEAPDDVTSNPIDDTQESVDTTQDVDVNVDGDIHTTSEDNDNTNIDAAVNQGSLDIHESTTAEDPAQTAFDEIPVQEEDGIETHPPQPHEDEQEQADHEALESLESPPSFIEEAAEATPVEVEMADDDDINDIELTADTNHEEDAIDETIQIVSPDEFIQDEDIEPVEVAPDDMIESQPTTMDDVVMNEEVLLDDEAAVIPEVINDNDVDADDDVDADTMLTELAEPITSDNDEMLTTEVEEGDEMDDGYDMIDSIDSTDNMDTPLQGDDSMGDGIPPPLIKQSRVDLPPYDDGDVEGIHDQEMHHTHEIPVVLTDGDATDAVLDDYDDIDDDIDVNPQSDDLDEEEAMEEEALEDTVINEIKSTIDDSISPPPEAFSSAQDENDDTFFPPTETAAVLNQVHDTPTIEDPAIPDDSQTEQDIQDEDVLDAPSPAESHDQTVSADDSDALLNTSNPTDDAIATQETLPPVPSVNSQPVTAQFDEIPESAKW